MTDKYAVNKLIRPNIKKLKPHLLMHNGLTDACTKQLTAE